MRCAIVSLDGLSIGDFRRLLQFHCELRNVVEDAKLRLSETYAGPIPHAQPIWASIITAESWDIHGCTGYAAAKKSLNALEVFTERDLKCPVRLPDRKSIYVNLPLLLPNGNRIWLSDGSLPINQFVHPSELGSVSPIRDYVPRPFSCTSVASADTIGSASLCLTTEETRIKCSLELCRREDWDLAIVRLNFFDLLAHLVAEDYLAADGRMSAIVESFCSMLSELLRRLSALANGNVIVMSPFSHTRCMAGVNLNQILHRAGLCDVAEPGSALAQARMGARLRAYQLVHGGEDKVASPVKLTQTFGPRVQVASPVAGAVYVNRADRFADGTVSSEAAATLACEARDAIAQQLSGAKIDHEFHFPRMIDAGSLMLPDFFVSAAGVDFSIYGEQNLDLVNHSRSTHVGTGFIALPPEAADASFAGSVRDVRSVADVVNSFLR